MAFLPDSLSNDVIVNIAKQKAGDIAEETVKKILGGGSDKKEEEKSGGGFNPGDLLSTVAGKKDDDSKGFSVGDAMSLVTGDGKKEGDGDGGLNVGNFVGGLFNK